MAPSVPRKKLIEVSIPLEAINVASAREKSMRHGHPSTLHLWWARRPLAACRAVLFAQLVDDPSSWPEKFPTEEAQDAERKRLHKVIERMVPWEASNDEAILDEARWEIARSVAWGIGEKPPPKGEGKAILKYLQTKAPPVYDPFCGGGSIPLEAQRLGLRAYGSDLNPVAVLISKALVEIPPKFTGKPPVNPKAQAELKRGRWNGKGAQGLAEDVRYYGQWMREEAEKRIGHFYPKATLANGSGATVIAWLWARTVRSPDPVAKGAMVPLVSSFMLSTKEGKKAWANPIIDPSAPDGWRFEVRAGALSKADESVAAEGTKTGRASFRCLLTGASISGAYVDQEAQAGRMSARLIAVIAEGARSRLYLSPDEYQEEAARSATNFVVAHGSDLRIPEQDCRGTFASNAMGRRYCFNTFSDYFTSRQLIALTTLSDLVAEVRQRAALAAHATDMNGDSKRLNAGGLGSEAYADAIATYLSFLVTQLSNHSASVCGWNSANSQMRSVFSRQAITMTWDFAEVNVFSESSGSIANLYERLVKAFTGLPISPLPNASFIIAGDAAKDNFPIRPVLISTDPPYYGNIAYADLSDFFYVWMRRSLAEIWPELVRRLLTPKDEELVATPYRHGGHEAAEAFFMHGMAEALTAVRLAATHDEPVTVYYAFKQSEVSSEGITSAGWASFLPACPDRVVRWGC